MVAAALFALFLAHAAAAAPPPQSFVWPGSSYRNDFKEGRVYLDPLTQNIPVDARHRGLRPPEPRVPEVYDIFLGLPSYRDGIRCGFTLWTAFARAKNPRRLHVGVVDQTQDEDVKCIDEYCRLAKQSWPEEECKYRDLIQIDARDSKMSNGPISVRAGMQKLIKDEEFCLTIDAHSQFIPDWDEALVREWNRTGNEMAVLSVYPPGFDKMGPNLSIPAKQSSHLCHFGGHESFTDMPWFTRVTIDDSEYPQMSPFWGGGLSFSKCHAEKRVPIDPYLVWIFIGEEYVRAMQLWTQGYDIYSPSRHGTVLFHNETKEGGHNGSFWLNTGNFPNQAAEGAQAYERLKMVLHFEVKGPVNGMELAKYYPRPVRSVDAFLNFSGISPVDIKLDRWKCEQLHWIPYEAPEIVEAFLPGYQMKTSSGNVDTAAVEELTRTNQELLKKIEKVLQGTDAKSADVQEKLVTLQESLQAAKGGDENTDMVKALQASNAELLKQVQGIAEHVENAKVDATMLEIKHQMKQWNERSVLGDYKEVIAIQALFVVIIVIFIAWRSRRGSSVSL